MTKVKHHLNGIETWCAINLCLKAMNHWCEFSIFYEQFFDNHIGAQELFALKKCKKTDNIKQSKQLFTYDRK